MLATGPNTNERDSLHQRCRLNMGLAKVAVQYSANIPQYCGMVNQNLVLRINPAEMRDGENRHLHQARNSKWQC